MAQIPGKLVRAFQSAYESKFGQTISAREAEKHLLGLAELIKIISNKEEKNGK